MLKLFKNATILANVNKEGNAFECTVATDTCISHSVHDDLEFCIKEAIRMFIQENEKK